MYRKPRKERKIFYNVAYSEEENQVLAKIPKWIEDENNKSKKKKKKKRIDLPEWLGREYHLKILYSSKFKRKDYLQVSYIILNI